MCSSLVPSFHLEAAVLCLLSETFTYYQWISLMNFSAEPFLVTYFLDSSSRATWSFWVLSLLSHILGKPLSLYPIDSLVVNLFKDWSLKTDNNNNISSSSKHPWSLSSCQTWPPSFCCPRCPRCLSGVPGESWETSPRPTDPSSCIKQWHLH